MSSKKDPFRALKLSLGFTGSARDKKLLLVFVPLIIIAFFASRQVEDVTYVKRKTDEEFIETKWKRDDQIQLQKLKGKDKQEQ